MHIHIHTCVCTYPDLKKESSSPHPEHQQVGKLYSAICKLIVVLHRHIWHVRRCWVLIASPEVDERIGSQTRIAHDWGLHSKLSEASVPRLAAHLDPKCNEVLLKVFVLDQDYINYSVGSESCISQVSTAVLHPSSFGFVRARVFDLVVQGIRRGGVGVSNWVPGL